jgi:FMN reductase
MTTSIVAVSGSLHAPSKSSALLRAITTAIETRVDATTHLVEVSELAPELGSVLRRDLLPAGPAHQLELVVASPVYRASYTGLFKHLFDLVSQNALRGTPVLVAASGGSDLHSLVIEHQLRPLFGFFEAHTLPIGVYAKDADFSGYEITSPDLLAAIERAADSAAGFLG